MQVISPQSWLVLLGMSILLAAGLGWAIFETIPSTLIGQGILISAAVEPEATVDSLPLIAEISGGVRHVLVSQGDYVEAGQTLLILDGGENGEERAINSSSDGLIVNLPMEEGSRVVPGILLAEILPVSRGSRDPIEVIAYVSLYEAQRIEVGMPVEVSPLNIPQQEFGFLRGTVRSVGQFPSNTTLASNFMVDNLPVIEVRVTLEPDESVSSGYTWSIGSGPDRPLQVGVAATVNVIVDTQRPIERILPIFG
jgi:multidrug efflux pump subunit AcrA (membrane-fusion protein)